MPNSLPSITILSGLINGQVLQRIGSKGATVVLQGTSTENGPVQATLFKAKVALKGWKNRAVGKIVRRKFSLKLSSIPVGGPYSLRLEAGGKRVEVASFFVGDVWIMGGQSNMEGVGDMTGRAKPHPLIRAFSMRREWRLAEDPLHRMAESPDVCHTPVQCSVEAGEEMRKREGKGVGVGVFFAREMFKRSGGVPQGLICTAHGGTSMQQWNPERKHLGGESLYASMLTSVRATGQPVAGMLWYQGESEANLADAAVYTPRMKKLVAASRRDFRQPKLPWMIVQLGRYFTDPASPLSWNNIQEQQRLLPGKIKFLETVPAVDLPLDDLIHIGSEGFPRLATRLACAADRLVYGNKKETRPLQLRSVGEIEILPSFAIEVAFDFVRGGLQAGGEPNGFQFVSSTGTPLNLIYKTELKKNKAKLHLTGKPAEGVTLSYGYGYSPVCNITDARGFSLPVFGPLPLNPTKPRALSPFIIQWKVSDIVPAAKKLGQVSPAEVKALATTVKSYPPEGFINEHEAWQGKAGQVFFHSRLHLSEPMKLEFLMGYDGPFRLWLDEKPFFANLYGTNPCLPDESSKTTSLEAGTHDLHVGMDLNQGCAWGFFLRLNRKDVPTKQICTGEFVQPNYSV